MDGLLMDVKKLLDSVNIADELDADKLKKIGEEARTGFDTDLESRDEWEKMLDQWTNLAKQTIERKNFPWPDASNVKYPLLSTAAMQFAARAYPSLIPSDGQVVKSKVVGKDPTGEKTAQAEAVSRYMSYQLLEEMDGWEEDMDKMLIMLPIVGTVFKKTYWDPITEKNCSKVVLPKDLVVNYWAKNLREAERVSEVLEINSRQKKERELAGIWKEVDVGNPSNTDGGQFKNGDLPRSDDTTPYVYIEQHTYLDLDGDGLKEPYIITFHKQTSQVVRIAPRFDEDSMHFNKPEKETEEPKVIKFDPIQYYTKFGFVPNPDGSFYDIGFGVLLGPLNESVNTLINQLVDSGTLNNLQSGFLGKGLRLRMGETRFTPGEWKVVNGTGDDLKKQIVPLPSKEPSNVLFELMGALITSGKELASVAEIFVGKMPGQNTPATTTMASIEQGMKVFTAVYKRLYRSLQEEFKKLYRLNGVYLNPNTYKDIVDMAVGPDDFKLDNYNICPGADPTAVSQTEKLMKAQGLMEMLGMGMPLDPLKVMIRILEAQEQPNWQELIPQEIMASGQIPQQPDPKMMEMQMKMQVEQQKAQTQIQAQAQKGELEKRSAETKLAMEAQKHEMEMQNEAQRMQMDAAIQTHKQRIFMAEGAMDLQQKAQQGQLENRRSEETHQQSLRQGEEANQAKIAQTKAQAKAKPQPKGKTKK
jgi:chaperonin GroES